MLRLSRHCLSSLLAVTTALRARLPCTAPAKSLADFHPSIAASFLAAAAGKLLQPQHLQPTSRRLVWWRCPYCSHEHTKRVDLHVAAGGVCPKCNRMPTLTSQQSPHGHSRGGGSKEKNGANVGSMMAEGQLKKQAVKHRCRPNSSLSVLAAPNANRVKSSIADDMYLRIVETRNLQPMLARSYDKEKNTISSDEELLVSPKLDGVRCMVVWNVLEKRLCFFSRSGTLFECCDHIEPHLLPLFKQDTTLVLDGELYSHNVDDFEQLTSAIRTTRAHRTPELEVLQQKLQYHVFDIMYAKKFADMSQVPFVRRYKFLRELMKTITTSSTSKRKGRKECYDVIQLVPVVPARKADVEKILRFYIADGYEGVMVRRNYTEGAKGGNVDHTLFDISSEIRSNFSEEDKVNGHDDGTSSGGCDPVGKKRRRGCSVPPGYAYGARSPNLLKYKLMHDSEYVIVDGVEGQGKWRGCLGAFVCKTENGHHFTVTPATSEENKREMWRQLRVYKGRVLTVQYQELSTNGVPRFPIGKCVRGAKNGSDWV
ncbi:putative Zinc ribbon domain [Trypanosoma vivax]|uniref:Putative DNA ligase n=1 Tax=Trypanosoma vivax (strain Y486) TaxID=1055687 RepID=G0TXK2_TRYVY|nr:putative Zinc ribbon domain [Trypanosoma vivax]CCC48692.1 putative DNA ligase [Trypanosoma vivax Y486]